MNWLFPKASRTLPSAEAACIEAPRRLLLDHCKVAATSWSFRPCWNTWTRC